MSPLDSSLSLYSSDRFFFVLPLRLIYLDPELQCYCTWPEDPCDWEDQDAYFRRLEDARVWDKVLNHDECQEWVFLYQRRIFKLIVPYQEPSSRDQTWGRHLGFPWNHEYPWVQLLGSDHRCRGGGGVVSGKSLQNHISVSLPVQWGKITKLTNY